MSINILTRAKLVIYFIHTRYILILTCTVDHRFISQKNH